VYIVEHPAYLILEDGAVFAGQAMGAPVDAVGEVVFTTSMTGYIETLTDPSYCGQLVVQAFPLIGNYGIIPQDFESGQPLLRGYIAGEWCRVPSNFRGESTLDTFLLSKNIPGVWGIDTRALVKTIRKQGVMNAKITHSAKDAARHAAEAAAYRLRGAVERASGPYLELTPESPRRRVALWDFGAKGGISDELLARGCQVVRMPWNATAAEILALRPDGVMLSNGPGDPADNPGVIAQLKALCESGVPLFGICLGHQLLALARGAKTGKLHYGHRGANQPVRDLLTGRVYITSQNHGYAVLADSLPPGARQRFENANDGTCEGVDYDDMPAFSVQFHPEGRGGPMDTRFLFDRFAALMDARKGGVHHAS